MTHWGAGTENPRGQRSASNNLKFCTRSGPRTGYYYYFRHTEPKILNGWWWWWSSLAWPAWGPLLLALRLEEPLIELLALVVLALDPPLSYRAAGQARFLAKSVAGPHGLGLAQDIIIIFAIRSRKSLMVGGGGGQASPGPRGVPYS